MSSSSPSKKKQPLSREERNNLILLAKGTLLTDILDTSPFHALRDFCARNHLDLRERMSDALNDVRDGWDRGTGPASEPPRTVIEVVHLARDRLMDDFGLEDDEGEQDSEGEGATVERSKRKRPVGVANSPLVRASPSKRRADVGTSGSYRTDATVRSRTVPPSSSLPVIEVVAQTSPRITRAQVRSLIDDEAEEDDGEGEDEVGEDEEEEGEEEEEDQIVEGQESSEDGQVYAEDFDFNPFLQSPPLPLGWFPWQDKRNLIHYGWVGTDVAPHALVEELHESCKVLLKQNVQDSWEQVELDRYFKSQSCLRCRKSSKTCIPPKGSDGIVTCGACKSSSQGCSHNSMIPIVAVMKKFRGRLSMTQVLQILHGMSWVSFQGVKIVNAFFKSVPAFPKLPIRSSHPSFVAVPPPSSSRSQLGAFPNPRAGPSPSDAIRARKKKIRELKPATSRLVNYQSEPPEVSGEVGVSEKSLGKRRAVEPEKVRRPAKKIRVIPPVRERAGGLGMVKGGLEIPSLREVAEEVPQDLQSPVSKGVTRPRPQKVIAVPSPQETLLPSNVSAPGSPQGTVQAAPEPPQSLPSTSVQATPLEDSVANDQATPQAASRPATPEERPSISSPAIRSLEPSIESLEQLIPRKFYNEATAEVNALRIQLAEEIRKRQEVEKKLDGSRSDFLFMSQASRMAVNASNIMVEISAKSKEVDSMVRQMVEDVKKREWKDEEPLEGMMPVFLEVKELRRELADVKEELLETKAQLESATAAVSSEAESSVKRLESELQILKDRREIDDRQLQNSLASGAKLALTSMHDVIPVLLSTSDDLTSSFNTLFEAANGLSSTDRNVMLSRLKPFKES
ncbi:hypothetical protein V5O48_018759, partial [Marasmius crinis-equi]